MDSAPPRVQQRHIATEQESPEMKTTIRYAAVYGSLSGAVIIATLISGLLFADRIKLLASEWFGYLIMLVALTFIFIGVKRYRDIEQGGVITFVRAFGVGIAIALVAALAYVLLWEVYLAATHYSFIDHYVAGVLKARQAAGMTGAALAKEAATLNALKANYANPLFRLPMTFMEIAPVGLIVALAAAALLRNPRFMPAR
jgi:hypothetical protein